MILVYFWSIRTTGCGLLFCKKYARKPSCIRHLVTQSTQLQWENTLTYDRSFGTDHHLTALVGSTALRYRTEQVLGSINGIPPGGSQFYYFMLAGATACSRFLDVQP